MTNGLLYPTKLIKVRMQAETGRGGYRSVPHAFADIVKTEGPRSLYKGFSVNCLSVLSSQIYITAYEMTRAFTRPMFESELACNLTAGVMASVVQQGVAVPIDVVSQRLMVDRRSGGASTARMVARAIIREEGAVGFWKGTAASLLTFAPTSGIFWAVYVPTHTHAHIRTHTHTHHRRLRQLYVTRTHSLSNTHSLTHSLPHSHALTCTPAQTHTHTHTHTHFTTTLKLRVATTSTDCTTPSQHPRSVVLAHARRAGRGKWSGGVHCSSEHKPS